MLILIHKQCTKNCLENCRCDSLQYFFSELKIHSSNRVRIGVISKNLLDKWFGDNVEFRFLQTGDIIEGIKLSERKRGENIRFLQYDIEKSHKENKTLLRVIDDETRNRLINDKQYRFNVLFLIAKSGLFESSLFKRRLTSIKYLSMSNVLFNICENHFHTVKIKFIYFYRAIINYNLGFIIWSYINEKENKHFVCHFYKDLSSPYFNKMKEYFSKSLFNIKNNNYPENKKNNNEYEKILGVSSFFVNEYEDALYFLFNSYKNYSITPIYGIKQEKFLLYELIMKSYIILEIKDIILEIQNKEIDLSEAYLKIKYIKLERIEREWLMDLKSVNLCKLDPNESIDSDFYNAKDEWVLKTFNQYYQNG